MIWEPFPKTFQRFSGHFQVYLAHGKPSFYIVFECLRHIGVSKITAEIIKSVNSDALFSDTRSETISIKCYVGFGSIVEGREHKNQRKNKPKTM